MKFFAPLIALLLLPGALPIALPGALPSAVDPKSIAEAYLEQNAEQFYRIADRIWAYAEPGCQEHWSSSLLADTLEKEGFFLSQTGMPTAFVASYGEGKPVIFLAEFDALPGPSQKAA